MSKLNIVVWVLIIIGLSVLAYNTVSNAKQVSSSSYELGSPNDCARGIDESNQENCQK